MMPPNVETVAECRAYIANLASELDVNGMVFSQSVLFGLVLAFLSIVAILVTLLAPEVYRSMIGLGWFLICTFLGFFVEIVVLRIREKRCLRRHRNAEMALKDMLHE
jgi:hypothetical protein